MHHKSVEWRAEKIFFQLCMERKNSHNSAYNNMQFINIFLLLAIRSGFIKDDP
jgi:hypothetical protein